MQGLTGLRDTKRQNTSFISRFISHLNKITDPNTRPINLLKKTHSFIILLSLTSISVSVSFVTREVFESGEYTVHDYYEAGGGGEGGLVRWGVKEKSDKFSFKFSFKFLP